MHTGWTRLWFKDVGSSCRRWTAVFSLDQERFSSRASKSGEQTILCLTVPSTDKSPVLPSVPTETSSWWTKGWERNEKKIKCEHTNTKRWTSRWRKTANKPGRKSTTSRATRLEWPAPVWAAPGRTSSPASSRSDLPAGPLDCSSSPQLALPVTDENIKENAIILGKNLINNCEAIRYFRSPKDIIWLASLASCVKAFKRCLFSSHDETLCVLPESLLRKRS